VTFVYKDPAQEKSPLAGGPTLYGITRSEMVRRKATSEQKKAAQKRNMAWSNKKEGNNRKEEGREKRKRKICVIKKEARWPKWESLRID